MNQHDQTLLVAIYLRLSKEDGDLSSSSKEESNSISNQRKMIHYYLAQHPEMRLVGEYCDDGYTGTNFNRPGFQAMLEDIHAQKINCVIVKDLSRFGRDYIEAGRYEEKIFPQLGVRFIALTDDYDSDRNKVNGSDIILPFKNLINDSYSRDISIKIRSNLEVKRQNGEFVGSKVGYGFKRSKESKNKLVIDPTTAPIIQDIFRWKIDGLSPNQIADRLNCRGVLSPAEYKRACGERFHTNFQRYALAEWSAVAVLRILKNEMYTGCLLQGKTTTPNYKVKRRQLKDPSQWSRAENAIEAIIPAEQFQLVQELLREDSRSPGGKSAVHPLSGKIFCADCGGTMIRKQTTSGRNMYVYFICNTHKKDKTHCSCHRITEQEVFDAVLNVIQLHVSLALDLEKALEHIDVSTWERRELAKLELAVSEKVKSVEETQRMKANLDDDLMDQLITQREYELFEMEFDKRIHEARTAIAKLESAKSHISDGLSEQQVWLSQFKACQKLVTLDRRTVAQFISRVEIGLDKKVTVRMRNNDLFQSSVELVKELKTASLLSDVSDKEVG